MPAGFLGEEIEAGIGKSLPWEAMVGWAALDLSPSVLQAGEAALVSPEAC